MMSLHPDTCALRMDQVAFKKITRLQECESNHNWVNASEVERARRLKNIESTVCGGTMSSLLDNVEWNKVAAVQENGAGTIPVSKFKVFRR